MNLLVVITVVSLITAVVMGIVAWRFADAERQRSEARVAALATEIRGAYDRGMPRRNPLVTASVIALLLVFSLATLVVIRASGPRPAATAAMNRASAPLELLALRDEREGDRLIIRGTVRNPAGAMPVQGLAAVVFAFDRDGSFLTSTRKPLGPAALRGGVESMFTVAVDDADHVGRYRVSFRNEDGIVAHVDRRARAAGDRP
jgi:hypothetical protein